MKIKDLLKYENFVVLGSTTNPDKPAYEIKNYLISKGYNVRCVGKELSSINLVDFDIDVLVLSMNPSRSINFLKETTKPYKAVVLQPGASSDEIKNYLNKKNIPFVDGCILCALKSE